MSAEDEQQFDTGPHMIDRRLGIALVVACALLAASQIWAVARHYLGARPLEAYEPAARLVFGIVFVLATIGVTLALLEQRNARAILDDTGIRVRSCLGSETHVGWDEIEEVVFTQQDEQRPDLPFHWLSVITRHGRSIRLAGGPWQQTRGVQLLRHKIVDRLGLEEHEAREIRWALLLKGMRTRWC